MNALRLSAAAAALTAFATAAAALGSCGNGSIISDCDIPTLGETAADGGPDPCHCAPPPSLNITTCACLSGVQQDKDAYLACMASYREEQDAGGEGGPIPGCSGECWPPPPAYWSSPVLLWFGLENSAPSCPLVAPFVFYNGYAEGSFALACASGASGTCPIPGDICAPGYANGFSQCVFGESDVSCPVLGPYTEQHIFFEEADGQPARASTFCCFPAPLLP